jgi:hypothetical protein
VDRYPRNLIRGLIEYGDEEKFAAVAALHRASVVNMQTPGGNIPAAIAIGRMVREHKLDTFLGRGGQCSSACPLILLSGRHVIVQQYSILTFHAANMPEGTMMMAMYLDEIGLTPRQIDYMLRTPPPGFQMASPADARALGFQFDKVSSLFGMWRNCQTKYCLAVP